MYRKYLQFVNKYRLFILIVVATITLFGIVALFDIRVDNSLTIWLKKDDAVWREYCDFKSAFGDDESLVVIYKNDSLFSKKHLEKNRNLTRQIEEFDHVKNVISLTNITIPFYTVSSVKYRSLIPEEINDSTNYQRKVTSKNILVNNIVSADGTATGIIVNLDSTSNTVRSNLIKNVETLLNSPEYSGDKYYLAGNIPLATELYRLSTEESEKYFLISMIVMFILIGFLYRSIILSIIINTNSLIIIIWTMSVFTTMGNSINIISGLIPIILLIVSYTISIHLISQYQREIQAGNEVFEAMYRAFKKIFIPCLFSIVTTAIAFISFMLTDIHPIITFGFYTFTGLLLTMVLSIIYLPAMLYCFKTGSIKYRDNLQFRFSPINFISDSVYRRSRLILFTSAVIFIFALIGATRLSFQTDQIRYFKKSNLVRVANDLAQSWFKAIYSIEIVYEIPDSLKEERYRNYRFMDNLEKKISQLNEVKAIYSPVVYINDFFPSERMRNLGLLLLRKNDYNSLERNYKFFKYISVTENKVRTTIRTEWMDNEKAGNTINSIDTTINRLLSSRGFDYYFTGIIPLYIHINQLLTKSQMINISFSFILIFLVFVFVYRSIKWSIIIMLPNIFPVVFTLGIMGWIGIPMDVATIMVAALSLGVSVDDSIHMIHGFRTSLAKSMTFRDKYFEILTHISLPITYTSLILTTGLLILVFSDYLPIAYMGFFVSINIVIAYLADILLTPSLIHILKMDTNESSRNYH